MPGVQRSLQANEQLRSRGAILRRTTLVFCGTGLQRSACDSREASAWFEQRRGPLRRMAAEEMEGAQFIKVCVPTQVPLLLTHISSHCDALALPLQRALLSADWLLQAGRLSVFWLVCLCSPVTPKVSSRTGTSVKSVAGKIAHEARRGEASKSQRVGCTAAPSAANVLCCRRPAVTTKSATCSNVRSCLRLPRAGAAPSVRRSRVHQPGREGALRGELCICQSCADSGTYTCCPRPFTCVGNRYCSRLPW